MKRTLFIILTILALSVLLPGVSAAEWKLHSTFDNEIENVADTPDAVYFLCRADKYNPDLLSLSALHCFLFKYDKEADELIGMNRQNLLSDQNVTKIKYNPDRGYLLAAYDNGNIDLIFDDGTVKNVPGFMLSDVTPKNINYISFDPENSLAYIATDFGYISINDENATIKESRNYGKKISSMAVFKDHIFINVEETVYFSPLSSRNHSFDSFKVFPLVNAIREFMTVGGSDRMFCMQGHFSFGYIFCLTFENGEFKMSAPLVGDRYTGIGTTREGIAVATPSKTYFFNRNGSDSVIDMPADNKADVVSTWDGSEFWFASGRKGFHSARHSGNTWSVTRDVMEPDASNVFRSSFMKYHPAYGLLVNNHGTDRNFPYNTTDDTPMLLSALKGMRWESKSPLRQNPEYSRLQINPNGLAVDPNDNDKVFTGSMCSGILRISLSDPDDILHMANPGDPTSGMSSFVKVAENQKAWGMPENFCCFSAPEFDRAGNMWIGYFDLDKNQGNNLHSELWYWTPENRLASKDAASFRPFGKIVIDGITASNTMFLKPLTMQGASNIVLYSPNDGTRMLCLIDHNGTLDNTSDDKIVRMVNIFDQDGTEVNLDYILSVFEDHDTGHVWVGTSDGLFTFRPSDAMKDPSRVNHIKVARNDGTDLADYLLDKAWISHISADPSGRKWFATSGGIVCTSADGRSILEQYTAENSLLPDNMVYNITYNPENNSMMISTAKGLAELFLTSAAAGEGKAKARAYPNPVRPDYFGYVTIDSLNDNALVKICDAAGGLVKELGLAPSGEIKWDVTNLYHQRVNSGVYYVLASDGPDGSGWSSVAKILVVN